MHLIEAARKLSKGDVRPRVQMDPATHQMMKTMAHVAQQHYGNTLYPNNIIDRAIILFIKEWSARYGGALSQQYPILGEIEWLYEEYENIFDLSKPKKKGYMYTKPKK